MHQGETITAPQGQQEFPNPWRGVALRLLLAAYAKAEKLECSPWQHAVRMPALRSAGIPHGVLRQLVHEGQIKFALEMTPGNGGGRSFHRVRALSFGDRMCFVLTAAGVATAGRVSFPWEGPGREGVVDPPPVEGMPSRMEVPRWNRDLHELRVGDWLVKRFRRPAPHQEAILDAFQEEGWPDHLDDPLPPQQGQDAKQRLHDTIKRMNRGQRPRLIRFMGNGQGTGIRWAWV